jgi:hypothetical protein
MNALAASIALVAALIGRRAAFSTAPTPVRNDSRSTTLCGVARWPPPLPPDRAPALIH